MTTKAKLRQLERRLEKRPKSFGETHVVQSITPDGRLIGKGGKILNSKSPEYTTAMKAREGKLTVLVTQYGGYQAR